MNCMKPSSSSTSPDDSSYFMIGLILGLLVTVYLQYRRGDQLSSSSSSSSSSSHASSLNPSRSTEENPHDVFISFRGEDTRRGFVSHLHDALRRKNIITYRDNSDLERGNKISSTLLRAIEQSKISIIVFSKNYSSSSWTKNELVKIMNCQETRGQVVFPIFYEISPSKVRKKRSYSTIFMFWSSMNETQQQWAKAMEEAAGLAGWDSSDFSTDSALVDVIVSEVKRHLKPLSHPSEGFPSRNGSLDEPNSNGSSHDDPTPEDSEPLSQSSERLPSRYGSLDEPNISGSSHDDPTPEDSESLSQSSEGLPSRNGSSNEPNSSSSSHDDPMAEDSQPLSQSSEGLPLRNGSPNKTYFGGLSQDDSMPEDFEPLSQSSEGLPSRNGSPDGPNSTGPLHDDPTPEDLEPLSQSSEGLPSRNGSLDEPNSGGSSHDDLTPEDSFPMNFLSSKRILNLMAYGVIRRKRHERLPDQPLNLDASLSRNLHRLAINENVDTGTVFYPKKIKVGTGGRTTVAIDDKYELKQIHSEPLPCTHSNHLQWPSS